MSQNAEAAAFLSRIAQLPPGPGVSLDDVLKPSIEDEAELRKLFAQNRKDSRLQDPYVGLVDVYAAPAEIRQTRARVVKDATDLDAKYVMPLPDDRRRKDGAPSMVASLEEFKQNWAVFTEGSLSQLTDWSNIVVAGGAVQACLAPVPESAKASKRALRKHFHSQAFPTSDVDLFLYGLTPEQAEVKMNTIYEAVRDSIPWDVTCIRTKHTVSIHSQYPYRAIQIVLRLYQSPAEILAGFDVDAPCCAFDGDRVYGNPRAIVAMMRQCNTIDVTRRSPSYEVRLAKYSARDFEIYVPQLDRNNIDPTIFERSIVRIQGLARLLVLEKLTNATAREGFVQSRRDIRGRPPLQDAWRRLMKRKYKGDLKGELDEGLEMADYDVVALHIPYGPGWDARRIDKLVYQTDLGMNSPFNPRNKGRKLHRHAAFFGTMKECLEDCCEFCPEPQNDEERALYESEEKAYLRGRIQFIVEDPGRQSMSGSFNPIDEGEWSEQAYMGATEKFFHAIASHDRAAVAAAIKEGIDVDRRDYVGRTPLQVAIISKATDIACDLIDAGARMTSRLVDGRTALHLAAQLNLSTIVRKLLEKSAVNAEEAKVKEEEAKRVEAANPKKPESGGDDVEMADEDENEDNEDEDDDDDRDLDDDNDNDEGEDEDKEKEENGDPARNDPGTIPEDEEDVPDVFEIDVVDWDYSFSALDYAVLSGSTQVVELLLAAGANPKLVTKPPRVGYAHPLILAAADPDDTTACKTAEKLIAAGAVTSEADDNLFTILHRAVLAGRAKLLSSMLRSDPNSKAVMDIPRLGDYDVTVFPIISAINSGSYSTLATLLAYGAKLNITEDDFQRARELRVNKNTYRASAEFSSSVALPVEAALIKCDDVLRLLLALGVDTSLPLRDYQHNMKDNAMTALDYARVMPRKFKSDTVAPATFKAIPLDNLPAWKVAINKLINEYEELEYNKVKSQPPQVWNGAKAYDAEAKEFYVEAEKLLLAHGAKSASELYPNDSPPEVRLKEAENKIYISRMLGGYATSRYNVSMAPPFAFYRALRSDSDKGVPAEMAKRYEELYEACWSGDHAKIQRLCLPSHKTGTTPLQIAVNYGTSYRGYSPLFIAILARRWETAKLIIAIATAQYSPEEKKQEKFTTRNIVLEGDDSESEDDSMDEDDIPEEPEVSLVDIAKRPSEIRTSAKPGHMLSSMYAPLGVKDGRTWFGIPVTKAILEDDFEAFVQILNLYNSLDESELYPSHIIASLITHDRPAMLDEFIRRTGHGISFAPEGSSDEEAEQDASKPVKPKMYLGLNVHGVKRKDLAAKGDPDAPDEDEGEELPILWNAARQGSMGIVRYFASDQPLAAYRFYAATHNDKRAEAIKRVQDLPRVLPEKLGWLPNKLNETVATAAIIGNHLGVLESLLTMRGEEIEAALHVKQRKLGFNSLLAAACWAVDPELFDFLLARDVSPLETDCNGFNIYHFLCSSQDNKHFNLLKHVLRVIPKDLTERLLRQQCKDYQATPLLLAVKKGLVDVVELLATQTNVPQQYLIRESGGSTPLHLAVSSCFAKITRILATRGPVESLTLENGVGTTPLEAIGSKAFEVRFQKACSQRISMTTATHPQFNKSPFVVDEVEDEIKKLKEVVKDLRTEGRIVPGTKLAKELDNFVEYMEDKIAKERATLSEKQSAAPKSTDETHETEKASPAADVLAILQEALRERPILRHLVHLADVHESVQKSLEKFGPNASSKQGSSNRGYRRRRSRRRRADMDGDVEAPPEEEEKKYSELTRSYEDTYDSWDNRNYY